ncbi:hypothetical protein Btru_045567 [Bulinus truncatus]|nr:hypothetical protein Btru_045567 [Bulinus truncatus]
MTKKSQIHFIDNVLLTSSSNLNVSFTTYLTSNDCFYINVHTNSDDLQLAQNLIKYPCHEILTDIIITCKCTTIIPYPLYTGLYIAQDRLNSSEHTDVTCGNNFFKCLNSTCLQLDKVQDGLKDCPNGEDEYLFRISDKICSGTLTVKGNINKIDESVFTNMHRDIKFNEPFSKDFKIFQFETIFYNSSHALIPEKHILKFFGIVDFLEIKATHCLLSTFKTSFRDWDLSKIVSIDISYNTLSDITDLNLLCELRQLNLSHNPNFTFNDPSLFPNSLQVLDLSYTNVHSLPQIFFYALKNLKELFLKGTKITKFYNIEIPPYTLNILDLRGLTLSDIQRNYFKNLNITLQILSDDFKICCQAVLGELISNDRCIAPRDVISSCEHLVGDEMKKILIWFIGFLTLCGNAFIVFYRLKRNQQTFKKSYDTLVLGLAISDGMMGIYLIIIASADVYFGEEYYQFHYHWIRGNLCTFAAFLSLFSTQLSTCFITLITFDRFMATKYPLKSIKMSTNVTRITILCLVIFEFILCLPPAIHPNWKICTFNGLCLALPVSSKSVPGWEYALVVFLALNSLLFVFIGLGQILIFINIRKHKQSFQCHQVTKIIREQELVVAKKLSLIAFSNLVCWVPIGVMGICSMNGVDMGSTIYGWTAVVLLPVNGSLNPFIYSLPIFCNRKKNIHFPQFLAHCNVIVDERNFIKHLKNIL